MAPRKPVDINNPSWGDTIRGNIKYGEKVAADFNDWWATRWENDKLAGREVFLDQMRNSPMNNALTAFEIGARNHMDKGGLLGPAFKAAVMPDPYSPEAMRKYDYAAGQLHPVSHLIGTGVGTTISGVDAILTGKALEGLYSLGKTGLGWLGGRLGLGAPVQAGPIGAWTNAATGSRAAPSAAAQVASWLGGIGRSAGSAVASTAPVTTAVVTKGALPVAAVAGGAAATNGLINVLEGKPAQFAAARDERAAAEQAAANEAAGLTPDGKVRKPDWYDQMAGIAGVDRDTVKEMVRQDGGMRIDKLQALNGMKSRAPTYRDLAMSAIMDSFEDQARKLEQTGDDQQKAALQQRIMKTLADILGADPATVQTLDDPAYK